MPTFKITLMSVEDSLAQAKLEIRALQAEINYYRSLLFARIDPLNASVLNALRNAVDVCDENRKLKEEVTYTRLREICSALEEENKILKARIHGELKQEPYK